MRTLSILKIERMKKLKAEFLIDGGDYLGAYYKQTESVMGTMVLSIPTAKQYTPEEFFKLSYAEQKKCHVTHRHVICTDGFSVSVQAGYGYRCSPPHTLLNAELCSYDEFEVGYPSEREELLMPYVEGDVNGWQTVYNNVPKDIVNMVIKKHGGISLKSFIC